jgi:hypothetical protein
MFLYLQVEQWCGFVLIFFLFFLSNGTTLLAEHCLSCGRKSYSKLSAEVKELQTHACCLQLACQSQWHVRQTVFY